MNNTLTKNYSPSDFSPKKKKEKEKSKYIFSRSLTDKGKFLSEPPKKKPPRHWELHTLFITNFITIS